MNAKKYLQWATLRALSFGETRVLSVLQESTRPMEYAETAEEAGLCGRGVAFCFRALEGRWMVHIGVKGKRNTGEVSPKTRTELESLS